MCKYAPRLSGACPQWPMLPVPVSSPSRKFYSLGSFRTCSYACGLLILLGTWAGALHGQEGGITGTWCYPREIELCDSTKFLELTGIPGPVSGRVVEYSGRVVASELTFALQEFIRMPGQRLGTRLGSSEWGSFYRGVADCTNIDKSRDDPAQILWNGNKITLRLCGFPLHYLVRRPDNLAALIEQTELQCREILNKYLTLSKAFNPTGKASGLGIYTRS